MSNSATVLSHDIYDAMLVRLAARFVALPDKPEETPETTLKALWHFAAGRPRSVEDAATAALPPLGDAQTKALEDAIERRLAGVPLAHITGRQRFMGVDLFAGPDALVPRKETELLGETAAAKLRETIAARGPVRMADICTGSGNLAVAIALREADCTIEACDLSVEALGLARLNAEHHGLSDRVTFRDSDLFNAFENGSFDGAFDLIVCNPPYISTGKLKSMAAEIADHEPALAFDGGGFGLSIVGRLIAQAPRYLKPGSWLCFEIGLGQGPHMKKTLERAGLYDLVETFANDAGQIRVLAARTR